MVIQPYDEIAFRIKETADKNIVEYKDHKVRITSANQLIRYKPKKPKKNFLTSLLLNWTPIIVLIAFWIFFMRRIQGKKSAQQKVIDIQENQYALNEHQSQLLEKQNKLFEKMIEAINNLKNK